MSTRQSFGARITTRARKVGWPVETRSDGSGGWLIHCPDGYKVQVHVTPSDVNAEQTIMRALNTHGFEDAEKEFNRLSETKRQARLDKVQEDNQRRLDLAQQQADALARASGQTRVPDEILLGPYPMPKTFERVLVGPDLAGKLLILNTANRPIRKAEVEKWKDIIERGVFLYTHQGIAVDSNGVLQDGQHRLTAILQTEIAVEMQISIGMAPANFNAVDNGLKRTFGDVAARLGLHSSSRVGSAARLLIIYNEYPSRQFNDKVSNAEVGNFLTSPYYETDLTIGAVLVSAVNEGQEHWRNYRINSNAVAACTYKLWELVGREDPKVVEFLGGLRSGVNLGDEDVRLALRRLISNPSQGHKRSAHYHLGVMVKAWNKFALNQPVKVLSLSKNEDTPKIIVPGVSDKPKRVPRQRVSDPFDVQVPQE